MGRECKTAKDSKGAAVRTGDTVLIDWNQAPRVVERIERDGPNTDLVFVGGGSTYARMVTKKPVDKAPKEIPAYLRRGLQFLKCGGQCAALLTPVFLERAARDGLIEDVPWDEKPIHNGLRWVRLTTKGQEVLAAATAKEAPHE